MCDWSWQQAQDDQKKTAMVWHVSHGKGTAQWGQAHWKMSKDDIQSVMNWNHYTNKSQSLSAWLMWSNYKVIEYEVVNQLKLEVVIEDNKD